MIIFFKENQALITGPPINIDSNNAVPTTIDVVTLEPDVNNVEEDSAFSSTTRVIKNTIFFLLKLIKLLIF